MRIEAVAVNSPPGSGESIRIAMMASGGQRSHQVHNEMLFRSFGVEPVIVDKRCAGSSGLAFPAGRRKKSLGLYGSEEEAAKAYDRAALSLRSACC